MLLGEWNKLIPDKKVLEAIQWALEEDDDIRENLTRNIKGAQKSGELLTSLHKGSLLRLVRGTVVADHVKNILKAVKGGKNIDEVLKEEIAAANKNLPPPPPAPGANTKMPTALPVLTNPHPTYGLDFEDRNLMELEEEGHRYFAERFGRFINIPTEEAKNG